MNKKLLNFITLLVIFFSFASFLPSKITTNMVASAINKTDVSNLNPTENTYSFIKSLEGCDLKCFWDVSQWTIGWGNKCPYVHSSQGTRVGQKGGHTISQEYADELFISKLSGYVTTLKSNCRGISMTQNQFDALLSATYNHGNVNNCPLKYYLQGTLSESEAREKYYVWYINAGSSTEKALRTRRKKEAELFFTDIGVDVKPTIVTTEYQYYSPKSEVTIQWESDENAESYWIDIYNGSDHIVSEQVSNTTTQYKLNKCEKGNYGVYIATIGSNNIACSNLYNFYVQDVEAPKVSTEKRLYPVGANVKISWTSPNGATSYWIDIWHDNTNITSKQLGNETEYVLSNCTNGNYAVYVTAMENTGSMSAATNEPYLFSVGQIEAPILKIERDYFSPNSNVEITWDKVDEATSYWIDIWNGNNHLTSKQLDASVLSYNIEKCQEGTYSVYVTAIESAGGAISMRSESKYFYVANVESPLVYLGKNLYFDEEDVLIYWSVPNGATSYWIDIWNKDKHIVSEQLGNENSYFIKNCKAGEYSVIITAFENTGALSSASSEKLNFNVILQNDCNNDGKFSITDVVMLQKYLLNDGTTLTNWQAADIDENGTINGIDLALMKEKIIS